MEDSAKKSRFKILIYMFLVGLIVAATSCDEKKTNVKYDDYLYQYSIVDALLAGVYDGNLTFGELKTKGDFGIGSFNHVDGEMLINNGEVYKIRFDGSVEIIPDSDTTSIAFVKNFKPDTVFTLSATENLNYVQLQKHIADKLNHNQIYAIRLIGKFYNMKTRSEAPAKKPYLPLVEHLKTNQYEFDLGTSEGTAVGFFLPAYVSGINVPGFHLHYISKDQHSGGHLLDFSVSDLKIEIDKASGLIVETIDSKDFIQSNLETNREDEVKEVEKGEMK